MSCIGVARLVAVTDVAALAGLPRLRVLERSDNAVADLSPLGALPALEYLGVAGNRVADVAAPVGQPAGDPGRPRPAHDAALGVGGRQPAAGRHDGRVAGTRLGGRKGRWALGEAPRMFRDGTESVFPRDRSARDFVAKSRDRRGVDLSKGPPTRISNRQTGTSWPCSTAAGGRRMPISLGSGSTR